MLNDIRLHLDSDETQQSRNEQVFAHKINQTEQASIAAFKTYIPNVGNAISSLPSQSLSLFVDKNKQTNIVNIHTGASFYNLGADQLIETQTQAWALNSALLCVNELGATDPHALCPKPIDGNAFGDIQTYASELKQSIQQQAADTLVVFGLGKAAHLPLLLNELKPKRLVIYEHNLEIFRVSLSLFDWARFLQDANTHNVQLFLQLGPQHNSIYEDISELCQHTDATRLLFFQHEKTTLSNQVIKKIRESRWGPSVNEAESKAIHHNDQPLGFLSAISFNSWQDLTGQEPQFLANLALFKTYFPDIYAAFKDYKSIFWDVVQHSETGQINLFNRHHSAFLSNNMPLDEGALMAQNFIQHPNLDGLAFGYTGNKLKHYIHNSFVCQADAKLKQIKTQQGELPEKVKALLVFGMGQGYMLESLYQQKDIQNLIICEPNPDFFYASLYAIDWAPIFAKVAEHDHKLYINIGEASSVLYKDLMSQFLALGPHLLNETYMMQSYDNPMLRQVLGEVRTQLQVIFSMGENFDHVLYGISHTFQSMQNGVPSLRYQPAQYLSHAQKQLPVFIVGNGPSLDSSVEVLKECREQVIVVSCGTALQALHKHGIVPDFHGEVEQNRANFDWVSRINDYAYLKKITLLSVNGMHPHSIALFKNVLLSFKHGESSTNAALAMLPNNSYHSLQFAYPTVSNMVVSLFLSMGFEQLYMLGIDLGFADQAKHHSAASGYYENGKQIYNYQGVHNTAQRAKGNKQAWVFTKTEFNISRMIMEEAIAAHKAECFNLSNGVFITGTAPLDEDNVLVLTSPEQKQACLAAMNNCFMALTSDVSQMFTQSYDYQVLIKQVEASIKLCNKKFEQKEDIDSLITALRTLLFDAQSQGGTLFFYYYFSTVSYACAAFSKAILQDDESKGLSSANVIREYWLQCLHDSLSVLPEQFKVVDTSDTFGYKREELLLHKHAAIEYCIFDEQQYKLATELSEGLMIDNLRIVSSFRNTPNTISLFALYQQHDIDKVEQVIQATEPSQRKNIALVIHSYYLIEHLRNSPVFTDLCVIYIPLLARVDQLSEAQQQGSEAYYLPEQYFISLCARAQDIDMFKEIVCKPRFCKTGLINANAIENNVNQTPSDEISALSVKNDYDSIAVKSIEDTISPLLNMNSHYMFSRYAGLPRTKVDTINMVDTLHNCGLLVKRSPFSFELLGVWQK